MIPIFIGYDSTIKVASDVLAYSLNKHATKRINIQLLKLPELNLNRPKDPLQSTEFTYTRFLVPHLCNFQGKALFMDNDMLSLSDISELLETPMEDCAIKVVKHNQVPKSPIKMDGRPQGTYPRKNWSSLMLMDCTKLTCWTKKAVETQPASWLHQFTPIPDNLIGELPPHWNVLDQDITPFTKLWHMTTGAPYFQNYANMPNAGIWYKAYYDMMNSR